MSKGLQTLSVGDVQQLPGIQSDDGNVYRMYVRQDGIYHITFSDLQNFGIDPTQIDPATLRIINKGQQVAVYVSDIYQDGKFHTDDYFEVFRKYGTVMKDRIRLAIFITIPTPRIISIFGLGEAIIRPFPSPV